VKPLKDSITARSTLALLAILFTAACSSSPPQDESSEPTVETEVTEASTDQVPEDLTQPVTYSQGLTDQTQETFQEPNEEQKEAEVVTKPIKKRRTTSVKRILSQETPPEPAPQTTPEPKQPDVQTPGQPVADLAPQTPPSPPATPYVPPATEQPLLQTAADEAVPFYKNKFFVPTALFALIALFFIFRKKR
jgi:hypothetical protein